MSVPQTLKVLLKEIGADRRSGAHALAERAAEGIKGYLQGGGEWGEEVAEVLCRGLMEAQPSMAPLLNLAERLKGCKTSQETEGKVDEFLRSLREGTEAVLQEARGVIEGKRVVTHSYSFTVMEAFGRWRPQEVLCPEGRPLCEGVRTARELGERGIRVQVVVDGAAVALLRGWQCVVVGADALTPQGLINKVGTYALALGARREGIPFFVLAGWEKFLSEGTLEHLRIEERPPEEVTSETIPSGRIRNIYFDITPWDLIEGVITPQGLLKGGDLPLKKGALP